MTTVSPQKKLRLTDLWEKDDGFTEEVIEIEHEPRHHIDFTNDFTRIITIKMTPKDTTLAHRHTKDTIVVVLMEDGIDFINDVMGCGASKGHMDFGQVGFAPYTSEPCVHKITNLSPSQMFVVNVEILDKPPLTQEKPLDAPFHTLVKEQHDCRVYKLSLKPGESTSVSYLFFYIRIILKDARIRTSMKQAVWEEATKMGDSYWKEPCAAIEIKNIGSSIFEAYICELI